MNGVRNYAGTGAKDFNEDNGLWKKFTTKQRILLGSIVAVIILALVILAVVVREAEHGNAYRVLLHSAGG